MSVFESGNAGGSREPPLDGATFYRNARLE